MKKYIIALFLILCSIIYVNGQRYPITVVPQVIQPAPVNFFNYADAKILNGPLRVQLLLNDITISNEQIRLKVSFAGNGITFESRDVVIGASSLFIDGGIPLILNNAELAPYFEFQNIQGINSNIYGNTIPEGSYQFCFEVFDFSTGNRLSSKTCTTTYIFKNEPPILNLPLKGDNIEPTVFDNIVFQWTPRHVNVSNVEYELSIVEIWDDTVDPQTAFLSVPPVFTTTTRATSFIYGPNQPLLLPEKRYAWRVQVRALQGVEEIGLFRNNGNSEVFWFSRISPCNLPLNVYAEPKGISKINVFWDEDPSSYNEYTIAYREANKPDASWFTMRTNSGWATIWNLKPGTTYEYKVKGKCKYRDSSYSDINEITTATAQDNTADYNCGIVPDAVAISNREPHSGLEIGDRITAGDFIVTIVEIEQQSNGRITGRGYVGIPYLKFSRFGVKFNNILINKDNQLAEGEIVTLYDPEFGEGETMSVDVNTNVTEVITGDQGNYTQVAVDFEVESIEVDENGAIIITGTNGEEAIISGGRDIEIIDEEGNVWTVDELGGVQDFGVVAEGGVVNETNTDGIAGDDVLQITSKDVIVRFEESGYYSFDKLPEGTEDNLQKNELYPFIPIVEGGIYTPAFKAISDLNGSDIIIAEAYFKNNFVTTDDIIFKTQKGIEIPATWNGSTATLILKKRFDYAITKVLATVKPKGEETKHSIAGVFNLVDLGSEEFSDINVVLVPVNDAIISREVETDLKEIYKKVGVNLKLTVGKRIEIPENIWDLEEPYNELNAGDSSLLRHYSSEEIAFNQYFKANGEYQKDAYYVFVTNIKGLNTKTQEVLEGFMPLRRQFGYVFKDSKNNARTIAHELGHGIFGLEHPFSEYGTAEGTTDFLMDNNQGTTFSHMDWKKIYAPGFKLYWFQGDQEGQSVYEMTNDEVEMLTVLNHIKDNINGGNNILKWRELTLKKGGKGNNIRTYGLDKRKYKIKIDSGDELKFKLIDQPQDSSDEVKIFGIDQNINIKQKNNDITYELSLRGAGEDIFVFEFDHYDDIKKCYNYLLPSVFSNSFSESEISKLIVNYLDEEVFPKNGIDENTDCNDIDLYFSEIPDSYIKNTIEAQKLWISLESLLFCNLDTVFVDEEKAAYTLINALSSINTYEFLAKIVEKKIEDKTIFQFLYSKLNSKAESKSFIEIIGNMISGLSTNSDKWEITNKVIKQTFREGLYTYHKFKDDKYSHKALNTVFLSMSENEVQPITELFVEMLISDCKHLDDFRIVYQIAKERYQNREAFAKFTQSEIISLNNGMTQSIGARSWVLPYDFEYNTNRGVPVFAKDHFYWAKILSHSTGRYNRKTIKNTELLKKPYQDFFVKFRKEYKIFLGQYEENNNIFWENIKVAEIGQNYKRIINHINKNENSESLGNVDDKLKIALLEYILTKPINDEPVYLDIKNDALLKIIFSFKEFDKRVLEVVEKIGFTIIYKNLSGDRLSKFLAWVGQQVIDSGKAKPLNKTDMEEFLEASETNYENNKILKLESNIFQFDNFSSNFIKGTNNINANGKPIPFDKMVMVYISDNFTFLGQEFKKGTILEIPMIHAFAISNSNWNVVAEKSAWLSTDVLSFAVGVGGAVKILFTTGKVIRKTIIAADMAGSAAGIVESTLNEGTISKEVRANIQLLSFMASVPDLMTNIPEVDALITRTDKAIDGLGGITNATRTKLKNFLNQYSEAPGFRAKRILTKIKEFNPDCK